MYVVIFSQLIQQKHNSYTMANYSTFSIEIEKRLKSILQAYNNFDLNIASFYQNLCQ